MALSKQLDLFSERAIQSEMFGGEYITARPYNNIGNGPIDFIIKDSKDYFDLKESVLCVKLKVVAADGTPIKTEQNKDDVALINNAMHSIFSDVQVFLNQKRVDGGDTLYGFRSYINTMLSYSTETQKNQLFAFGFVKDDYNAMDAKTKTAFIATKAWTANGALKTFRGKLNCSLFQQDRLLILGVDLHVKLERAKDAFALFNLVETIKPKIVIEEAILHLLKVKVNPAIMQHHAMTLARNVPAIYELNRVEIDTIPVKKESLGVIK